MDRHAFWHSVAFHNYVAAFMPGPSVAPSFDDWVAGGNILKSVLQQVAPGRLLVLGQRLWSNLKSHSGVPLEEGSPMVFEWGTWETARLEIDGLPTIGATWIKHPSRARRDEWHEVTTRFLGGAWNSAPAPT